MVKLKKKKKWHLLPFCLIKKVHIKLQKKSHYFQYELMSRCRYFVTVYFQIYFILFKLNYKYTNIK